MIILLTVVHVITCLFLIGVVLLQSGQSADVAATFGGAGSQTAFGPRAAASGLTKATTAAAVIFMITSFSLAILASRSNGGTSVLDKNAPAKSAPATPAPAKK